MYDKAVYFQNYVLPLSVHAHVRISVSVSLSGVNICVNLAGVNGSLFGLTEKL